MDTVVALHFLYFTPSLISVFSVLFCLFLCNYSYEAEADKEITAVICKDL